MENENSHGNNYSDGNNWSNGNNSSHGNNNSHGNNGSHGNNYSDGNNYSNGNNWSNGNNSSHGNNNSHGNNGSHGNNYSDGNNYSNGNNYSDGNNGSNFLFNCQGTHKSIFCKDKQGIAYEIFNQKFNEEKYKEFRDKLSDILAGFLPRTINYQEMLKLGWHKEYKEDNKYVEEFIDNDNSPYTKQYHDAWSRLEEEKKKKLIELIKNTEWLDTKKSLIIFTEITGIDIRNDEVKIEIDGQSKFISRKSAIALGVIKG